MAKAATLNVKVLVDAAQAASGLDAVGDKVEGFGSKLSKLGGAAAAAGIVAFAAKAVSAASDLQDAMGSVDSVFKSNAAQVHAWASDTTDSIRLPQAEFEAYAASMGSMLKNAGVPMDQLAGKTHELIQLAADLSAQSGQTANVGVEAMKAALKGEYEQLENLNVSITAAQVSTEALRIAQGDAAQAADPLVKQQAALNLIMKQSGDALGAAARESGNFASQQDHLNEVWTNFLAAVGGPLLGVLSSLLGAVSAVLGPLSDMIPVVVELAGVIGDVLLNPVLLVGGAFLAWNAIGGIAGILLNLRVALLLAAGAVRTFFVAVGPVGWAILALAAGWEAFKAVTGGTDEVDAATESIERLKDAAKQGKLEFKTAIFDEAQVGGFSDALANAGVDMDTYIDASIGVKDAQAELQGQINKSIATIFEAGGAFQSIGADAKGAGINTLEFLGAVESGNLGDVTSRMQAYADEQARLSGNQQTGVDIMNRWNAATMSGVGTASALLNTTHMSLENQKLYAMSLGVSAEEANKLGTAEGKVAEEAIRLQAVTEDLAGAHERYGDALKRAAEGTELETTLGKAEDAAAKAEQAMALLNEEIEVFNGRNRGLSDAAFNFGKALAVEPDTLTDVQKLVQLGGDAATAVTDVNDAWLAGSAAGQAAREQLFGIKDAYDQTNKAAFEAALKTGDLDSAVAAMAANSKQGREQFLAWAAPLADMGVDINKLADNLGILDLTELSPKLLEILTKDEDAKAALAAFEAAGIKPKDVVIKADDQATEVLDATVTYIDSITGQPVEITVGANPADANAVLQAILADIAAKHPELGIEGNPTGAVAAVEGVEATAADATAIVDIDGNPVPAENEAEGFTAEKRETYPVAVIANSAPARNALEAFKNDYKGLTLVALINANTAPARNAVESFRGDYNGMSVTATILGNSAPARNAIAAIENGSYSATVRILADTSSFYASFNSLPASRGVAAAPAAVPQLMTATTFAAPTLQGGTGTSVATRVSAPAGINITINGALFPDDAARAVEDVLRRRERRTGAVVI